MVERVEQTTINGAAAEVWRVLADFGGISQWASNVDHSCLMAEQADGEGAVRRIQTGRNTVLERVVEWEPEQRLAYEIEGLPPVIRSVTNTWQLNPTGAPQGAYTVVTLTSTINVGPKPPQQVVAKVVGRVLAKASVQMLTGLKHHVESSQRVESKPREGTRA